MDLQESFSKVVSGLVVNDNVVLTEKEISQAAELLVWKALVKLSLLKKDDNASVTVGLKGITSTKNRKSKEAIYTEAMDIINIDGSFNAELQGNYPKCRLVVSYKELGEL